MVGVRPRDVYRMSIIKIVGAVVCQTPIVAGRRHIEGSVNRNVTIEQQLDRPHEWGLYYIVTANTELLICLRQKPVHS